MMIDFTDATLRERLTTATDICNVKHGTGDYDDVQICEDCILAFGIALREAAREEEAAQSREALAVMGLNYDNAVAEGKANVQRAVDAARAEADCGCSREVTHGDSCPAWCHIRVQIQEARAEQREANLEIIQHGLEHCAAQGRELTPRNVIAAILTAIRSQR